MGRGGGLRSGPWDGEGRGIEAWAMGWGWGGLHGEGASPVEGGNLHDYYWTH